MESGIRVVQALATITLWWTIFPLRSFYPPNLFMKKSLGDGDVVTYAAANIQIRIYTKTARILSKYRCCVLLWKGVIRWRRLRLSSSIFRWRNADIRGVRLWGTSIICERFYSTCIWIIPKNIFVIKIFN